MLCVLLEAQIDTAVVGDSSSPDRDGRGSVWAINLSDMVVLALRVGMLLIQDDRTARSCVQSRTTKLLCQLYAHTRACQDDSRAPLRWRASESRDLQNLFFMITKNEIDGNNSAVLTKPAEITIR